MAGYSASYPTPSFGQYRGAPQFLGTGSNQGEPVAGNGQFAAGQGPAAQGGAWEPSILYLFGFIVFEMIVFGFLARHLR